MRVIVIISSTGQAISAVRFAEFTFMGLAAGNRMELDLGHHRLRMGDPDFYRQWAGPGADLIGLQGPYLDVLNAQSSYSPALLDLFCFLIQSPE
ncbi:MAG: hypothetical protein KIT09_08810 [Bryobacteraceae bacterium]|nr:hypothetical protein [Bryobacteraceae bacterium]